MIDELSKPLRPSPQLLEKLAGIVHTAVHELHGTPSATRKLCLDLEVIGWAREMRAIGMLPEATKP